MPRTQVGILGFAFVCLMLAFSPSWADSDMEQVTGISITPRFWLPAIDPVAGAITMKEAYVLPMYGATLAVTPGFAPRYTVLLTGLWGEGDGDVLVPGSQLDTTVPVPIVGDVPVGLVLEPSPGTTDAERLDVELLVRRRFPDKWFSLFFGPRYASWKETTAGDVGYSVSFNNTVVDEQSGHLIIDLETDFYAFEFGLGTVAEMATNGRHYLFSNFIFAAAYTKWEGTARATEGALPDPALLGALGLPTEDTSGENFDQSLDANLGYQYGGDRYGFSARYRVFVLTTENGTGQTVFTTLHGPELGVTITL